MRRAGVPVSTLLLCGLCLLCALSALAFAAPAHRSAAGRTGSHRRGCRARQRHTRRSAGCRPSRHAPAGSPSKVLPRSSSPSAVPVGGGETDTAGSSSTPPPTQGAAPPGVSSPESTAPAPPPSIPHVQVTAVEYSFTLSRTTVPAGKVIFEFVNNGQDEHNLNVLPTEGPAAATFPNAPSKGVSDQQIDMRPGAYTLFCSLPEHESKGMKATLVVE
jgi:plastocyanin